MTTLGRPDDDPMTTFGRLHDDFMTTFRMPGVRPPGGPDPEAGRGRSPGGLFDSIFFFRWG